MSGEQICRLTKVQLAVISLILFLELLHLLLWSLLCFHPHLHTAITAEVITFWNSLVVTKLCYPARIGDHKGVNQMKLKLGETEVMTALHLGVDSSQLSFPKLLTPWSVSGSSSCSRVISTSRQCHLTRRLCYFFLFLPGMPLISAQKLVPRSIARGGQNSSAENTMHHESSPSHSPSQPLWAEMAMCLLFALASACALLQQWVEGAAYMVHCGSCSTDPL